MRLQNQAVLVACSGGADSLGLLLLLHQWQRALNLRLAVAHVHHGPAKSRSVVAYRRRAQEFSRALAEELSLPFFTNSPSHPSPRSALRLVIQSEAELRRFRYQQLNQWREEWAQQLAKDQWVKSEEAGEVAIALAHHGEDLLETRLIRLIRGVGAQGLRAMRPRSGHLLRPLLGFSREEIREFLRAQKRDWLEDPSNGGLRPLRNWLRENWLKSLEGRQPGALKSLARSLEVLAAETSPERGCESGALGEPEVIEFDRAKLAQMTELQRTAEIVRGFRHAGLKNYSARHAREILKRLDKPGRGHSFRLIGLDWHLDSTRIWASRDSRKPRAPRIEPSV